jgi:deazaflavin-dependent oxidoreductase (nitroreductase family)
MNPLSRGFNAIGGRILVRTGRVAMLGTTGAKTGMPRRTPVGFVTRDDGSILIGAGSTTPRGWTANVRANPVATLTLQGTTRRFRARLVAADERGAALAELKATMGGRAERADWGDLFILEPEA